MAIQQGDTVFPLPLCKLSLSIQQHERAVSAFATWNSEGASGSLEPTVNERTLHISFSPTRMVSPDLTLENKGALKL